MGQVCKLGGGCKSNSIVYGVVNPETNRLHRLTFSRSLANHIVKGTPNEVRRFNYVLGRKLEKKERSSNGLYGIVSSLKNSNDLVLRISLCYNTAQLLTPDRYRHLAEVWLESI